MSLFKILGLTFLFSTFSELAFSCPILQHGKFYSVQVRWRSHTPLCSFSSTSFWQTGYIYNEGVVGDYVDWQNTGSIYTNNPWSINWGEVQQNRHVGTCPFVGSSLPALASFTYQLVEIDHRGKGRPSRFAGLDVQLRFIDLSGGVQSQICGKPSPPSCPDDLNIIVNALPARRVRVTYQCP
ncbi:MAG TPA: hypothetical protein DD379_09605 [Cyanobacteria bacterium UBA11162]|nr:hypothetical protein [Cyanobacteria bacterium UBA11162]